MSQSGTAVSASKTSEDQIKQETSVSPVPAQGTQKTPEKEKEGSISEKEKFAFLTFRKNKFDKTERWEARRKIDERREARFFIDERTTLRPESEDETWACRTLYEFWLNDGVKIIVIQLVAKTALKFGKEQVLTFSTRDKSNILLPRWSHNERVNGTVIKRVPLKNGPIPKSGMATWKTSDVMMIACQENGLYQIIGVRLLQPLPPRNHPESSQRRFGHKTQKAKNIRQ